jgi:hypothetical protein
MAYQPFPKPLACMLLHRSQHTNVIPPARHLVAPAKQYETCCVSATRWFIPVSYG